jgi:hypothetical protein
MTAFIADMERQYTYTLSIYIIMTAFSMMIALSLAITAAAAGQQQPFFSGKKSRVAAAIVNARHH